MFSEYRFVEVSNSMTFRPPQIHSLFFPASDFEKISKFSKPNHFYVVSNRVEVKRIFRFYRNMDEDFIMAQKMTGALVFDERTDRYDIRFDLNSYYGGLHCGECFDVFVRGKWKPTRIEYGDNWYLVGIRAEDLNGLRVRI